MSWHATADLLERYANGDVDDASAYSLEAHLVACGECQRLAQAGVSPGRVAATWAEIEDAVDQPRLGFFERLLVRLGIRPPVARLLAATPSLRISWFAAAAVALAFAILAAREADGERALLLFLVVAPLLPVAGVAAAYGPGVDPTYELVAASPVGRFRLLLLRSAAVLGMSALITGVAALALPGLEPIDAAWLLPALGLSAGSLALATFVTPVAAAATVAAVWVAGVFTSEVAAAGGFRAFRVSDELNSFVFQASGQVLFLFLTVAGALVLVARRDRLEMGSPA